MKVEYRKLSEGAKTAIFLSASNMNANGIEPSMAVSSALRIFEEVEKQSEAWEQARYTEDIRVAKNQGY